MATCPACAHENEEGATFCGQCGTWLDVPDATGVESPRGPTAVLVAVILGLGGLGAATAYRVVTRPGRELPPHDEKLRALRGPPAPADDETRPLAPDQGVAPDAGRPDAKRSRLAKRDPGRRRVARPTRRAPRPTPAKRPAAVRAAPRPTSQAIRACINQHRSRLRRCLEQSALRMEPPPGGTGRAVLQPDGRLDGLQVPGGWYFSSCVKNVLSTVRCRPFDGAPVPISYPLRW